MENVHPYQTSTQNDHRQTWEVPSTYAHTRAWHANPYIDTRAQIRSHTNSLAHIRTHFDVYTHAHTHLSA